MHKIPSNRMMSLLEYTEAKKRNDPILKVKSYRLVSDQTYHPYKMSMNPEKLSEIIRKVAKEYNDKSFRRGSSKCS